MSEIESSPSRQFGHSTYGYAVEFNLEGVSCRTITVAEKPEAEMIKRALEGNDDLTSVQVVRDD